MVKKAGSRSSPLALQQTNTVIQALALKGIQCDIITMTTKGDRLLGQPLPEIGGKGLFTEELESALRLKQIDFVVHSLKDLPTTMAQDLLLVAILKRDDPNDCIVAKQPIQSLSELSSGSIIGTSSFRRSSQLKRQFPHLEFQNIRGNIHTRLSKLDSPDSPYSAIVLATAGLERMDLKHRMTLSLKNHVYYAVGQGALAVQCRKDDVEMIQLLSSLTCLETWTCCLAERACLEHLNGGCSVPVGVRSQWRQNVLQLQAIVLSPDGTQYIKAEKQVYCDNDETASDLGKQVAEQLLDQGAKEILSYKRF